MKILRASNLALFGLLCVLAMDGFGQAFPSRLVRVIVPYPAGGLTDVLAREVATQLQPRWGVPVVIDNRAGGGTLIGSEQVAHAAGDPHMLLLTTGSSHVVNPSLYKSLPYDTIRDFTPLAIIASTPNILFAHPSFPAKSVAELIQLAKEKPGAITFASTGTGGMNHLAGELLNLMAGISLVHVPYKGEAPALNDVLAGHVPLMISGVTLTTPHFQSGKLRPLAVTTVRRVASLPDVPTLDESGLKGFEASGWFALFGPARLPPGVTAKIASDVGAVTGSEEIRARFAKMGVDSGTLSQPEFARYVENEVTKWGRLVEKLNIPKL